MLYWPSFLIIVFMTELISHHDHYFTTVFSVKREVGLGATIALCLALFSVILKLPRVSSEHTVWVLRVLVGLTVPAQLPGAPFTLPTAQDPISFPSTATPQQGQLRAPHSPSWPWGPLSQAHHEAHVPAWAWPIPVPRKVSDAREVDCPSASTSPAPGWGVGWALR